MSGNGDGARLLDELRESDKDVGLGEEWAGSMTEAVVNAIRVEIAINWWSHLGSKLATAFSFFAALYLLGLPWGYAVCAVPLIALLDWAAGIAMRALQRKAAGL